MKKTRNMAFIVELLLLFVILLFVIVVVTKTFMTSRGQSQYARQLTEAVCVAEEVAEVTAAAGGKADAARLLESLEQTDAVAEDEDGIGLQIAFGEEDAVRRTYEVYVRWEAADGFAQKTILVFAADREEPLYTLETGTYSGNVEGGDAS